MWSHVQWPRSCLPTAPHPCPFPLHPQLLQALSVDPTTMEAMMEKMMEKMTNKVVCAWVCVFLLAFGVHFVSVLFVQNLTGVSLFLL